MSTKVNSFIKKLAQTRTGSDLFNPYNELTKPIDDRTAPGVRQQNLRLYLNAHEKLKSKVMCIYYSPSYDESKRSGVPLTNISNFGEVNHFLGIEHPFEKATKSRNKPKVSSMASILWNLAERNNAKLLFWPVVPFYPHKKGGLKKVRNFTHKELLDYRNLLSDVVTIFEPKTILSIGKDTDEALSFLKVNHYKMPHPRRSIAKFETALKKELKKIK